MWTPAAVLFSPRVCDPVHHGCLALVPLRPVAFVPTPPHRGGGDYRPPILSLVHLVRSFVCPSAFPLTPFSRSPLPVSSLLLRLSSSLPGPRPLSADIVVVPAFFLSLPPPASSYAVPLRWCGVWAASEPHPARLARSARSLVRIHHSGLVIHSRPATPLRRRGGEHRRGEKEKLRSMNQSPSSVRWLQQVIMLNGTRFSRCR